MRAYLIRRSLLIIPTLFILTIIVFLAVRFIPGDAIDVMMMSTEQSGVDREAVERMLGLDVPVYVQYGRWIGALPTPDRVTGEPLFRGLLQGTFGESLTGGWSIEERIIGRLPVTIELGVMAIVIGLIIALPVGIYSAIRQDTATDYAGRTVAVIGLATPNFFVRLVKEKPLGMASGIVILLLILVALFGGQVAPYPYNEIHLIDRLTGPSSQYPLGTDQAGRDLLSRLIFGARISVLVGLAVTTLSIFVSTVIGGTSGFVGGKFGER